MMYRWKRSVPADSAMGFEEVVFRAVVAVEIRERVSDMVPAGEVERRVIRDSIAAMGWVRKGSVRRRWL